MSRAVLQSALRLVEFWAGLASMLKLSKTSRTDCDFAFTVSGAIAIREFMIEIDVCDEEAIFSLFVFLVEIS